MKFTCLNCNQELESTEEQQTGTIRCPECEQEVHSPASDVTLDASAPVVRRPAVSASQDQQKSHIAAAPAKSVDPSTMTIDDFMTQQNMQGGVELNALDAKDIASSLLEAPKGQKYKLGRSIAQGGMGAILDVKDVNIRRNVAMKVMLRPESATKQQVIRFIEEAQITGQLEHPGVVPVYELGVDAEGKAFYTMKFVSGLTLKDILNGIKDGSREMIAKYPLSHLLTIYQKVCDAIAFAHSKRVVHRDLKPENIMVGEYGEVQVMDWGLAKVLGRDEEVNSKQASLDSVRLNARDVQLTMAGDIMGTPGFMAPEQAMGEIDKVDERTDTYALGGMLYNILVLQPPITGKDVGDVLRKVTIGDIVSPSKLQPKSVWLSRGPLSRPRAAPARAKETAAQPDVTMAAEEQEPSASPPVADRPADKPKSVWFSHCPGGRIPVSLAAVAMKALSLKQEDRYSSVKELQADIEAYQNGFATSAEEASPWKLVKLFVKRHKVITSAAALLLVVVAVGTWINYLEQAKRRRDRVASAPSWVQNAKDITERGDFAHALTTVEMALEYDQSLAEARFVHAILLFRAKDYRRAFDEWKQYAQANAQDREAGRLLDILRIALKQGGDAVPMGELATFVEHHGMHLLAAQFLKSAEAQLALYQHKIEKAWKGFGARLTLTSDRKLKLNFTRCRQASDLTPLQGIPLSIVNLRRSPVLNLSPLKDMELSQLNISGTKVSDLTPLRGMPLTALTLSVDGEGCPVADLGPLKGMKLTELDLSSTKVDDLAPLRGMMLTTIDISGTQVSDLSPLRGMPLKYVGLSDGLGNVCPVTNLSPLKGMKLTRLNLVGIQVADLTPLVGMPLTKLDLSGTAVTKLAPLAGMPLKTLYLRNCSGITDLSPLKGMSLNKLILRGLGTVTDLSPLKGMQLTRLDLFACEGITDLSPLRGMPLTSLELERCKGITDLSPLQNMRLTRLDLSYCTGITDLTPLQYIPLTSLIIHRPGRITKGMDVLRSMKSLAEINMTPSIEFWKSYDAGEFKH